MKRMKVSRCMALESCFKGHGLANLSRHQFLLQTFELVVRILQLSRFVIDFQIFHPQLQILEHALASRLSPYRMCFGSIVNEY